MIFLITWVTLIMKTQETKVWLQLLQISLSVFDELVLSTAFYIQLWIYTFAINVSGIKILMCVKMAVFWYVVPHSFIELLPDCVMQHPKDRHLHIKSFTVATFTLHWTMYIIATEYKQGQRNIFAVKPVSHSCPMSMRNEAFHFLL